MFPATPQRTAESALARAGAHHAAGDHLRRREREAEVRGGQDHRRAGALRGEALRRVHLDDPRAHRPDDPPARRCRCRARSPRRPRPRPRTGRSAPSARVAVGDQRERDHAHRLLGVVRPVREREQPARDDLAEPEAPRHGPGTQPAHDPVGDDDRERAERRRRRSARRPPGSGPCPTTPSPITAPVPTAAIVDADHAADQRVRGARGQAEVPGDQVPGDRADQPGEDRPSA